MHSPIWYLKTITKTSVFLSSLKVRKVVIASCSFFEEPAMLALASLRIFWPGGNFRWDQRSFWRPSKREKSSSAKINGKGKNNVKSQSPNIKHILITSNDLDLQKYRCVCVCGGGESWWGLDGGGGGGHAWICVRANNCVPVKEKSNFTNLDGEDFENQAGTLTLWVRKNPLRKLQDLSDSFKRAYLNDYWAYHNEKHTISKVSLLRVWSQKLKSQKVL